MPGRELGPGSAPFTGLSSASSSRPERAGEVLTLERVGDVRHQEPNLRCRYRRCGPGNACRRMPCCPAEPLHRVGQLDFAAGTRSPVSRQDGEDFGLQDVATGNDQVRWRRSLRGLLHHRGDLEALPEILADCHDAVLMRLVVRHLFDRDDVAAVTIIGLAASGACDPRLSMSGRMTAKGSSPTISRAHHTA